MIFTLLLSPAITSAQSVEEQKVDYLALGDSLAAGQTPNNTFGKGYTDFIGSQLEKIGVLASFDKRFAVSGYTTTNLLNDIQTNVAKPDLNGNRVEIQSAIKNAEIITIDAGANDLLQQIEINRTTREIIVDQEKLTTALNGVAENLATILTQIKSLNPKADIYIMGYYNPFPYLPDQTQITSLLSLLNKTISDVGDTLDVAYIPTSASFEQNARVYLPNPLDIHPNVAGYLVLANEFWKAINVEKNTSFKDVIPDVAKDEITFLAEKGIISGYENGEFRANDLISRVQSAIMLNRAIVYSDESAPDPGYVDVKETSPRYEVIAKMTEQGVFSGSNHYFYPEKSLTRAEMAKVLVQAFHFTGASTKTFSDTNGHWAIDYISTLAEKQIVNGYGNGSFKPNEPITRAEFSMMLARALDDRFINGK